MFERLPAFALQTLTLIAYKISLIFNELFNKL